MEQYQDTWYHSIKLQYLEALLLVHFTIGLVDIYKYLVHKLIVHGSNLL